MTLERRTPLRRGKPLKAGKPLARGKPLGRGNAGLARGAPLRPVSDRRAAERPAHDIVRAWVFVRDRQRCLLAGRQDAAGQCRGPLTPHHVRKAGQGGPYTRQNIVTLCAGHNEWVETSVGAPTAYLWGLWCRRGETLATCWLRMLAAGLVDYDSEGHPA